MMWLSFVLPVFITAASAFLAGLGFGIWLVVRFCEVTRE